MFSEELKRRQPVATKLFSSALENERLAAAYLLTGRAPEDKIQLAKELVSILNCQNLSTKGFPCSAFSPQHSDACTNCRWIAEDAHPQALRILGSENGKKSKIPVEKARELTEELAKTSLYHRTVIVEDACEDVFHRPAANALLKSIEEPRSGVTFLFFALTSADVLKTIVSRCQVIECKASPDLALRSLMTKSNQTTNLEKDSRDLLLSENLKPFIGQSSKAFHMNAINLATAMQELLDQEVPFVDIVDYLCEQELRTLADKLTNQEEAVRYARDLLTLSEEVKLKLSHYVSQKAVAETFAFSWTKLRERLLASHSFARSRS